MSRRGPCADCDPSTASTASVSSDLHKYHVACSCGGAQYAECASVGGPPSPQPPGPASAGKEQRPPALPPRPPPRPRPRHATQGGSTRSDPPAPSSGAVTAAPGPRKYVWWCLGMGATACLLGGLLLAAAMLLRAHTDSLHHLETIPTPVPAAMLVATGLCIMSLARRRNRYSYLVETLQIKVVGACCLVCALTCVLVTITTTVIHMNRLQTLRKCVYTEKTRTCTCYSALTDGQNPAEDEEGVKCVFEAVVDCGTVHGALYKCLGAVFGLSVAGVLVCICSAMLAYQLLSHERKKMYWEQLELRCRSLYRPAGTSTTTTQGGTTRPHSQQPQVCGECCAECRAAAAVSWDLQHRIWASGRVGNLYSPNPGTGRRVSPWSWFPWPRNSNQRVGGSSSGDSAYGFGANSPGGYWQLGPPPPYTPHHRYLHHHMQQMSHHHHTSQPNSATTNTQQRRACQHAHRPTVSEDFSEELEEVHQHTCQKYQHPVPEGVEETVLQGEENLAFQCEKQSPQRQQQARSGESELYFADVSSCCNVSLKALEYCGGGMGITMDSQGDSSSDESEGVAQAQARSHRHKHRHNVNAEGMAACSQSPSRGRQRNPNNTAHQSREANRGSNIRSCDNPGVSGNNACRSNIRSNPNTRSDLQYSENEEEMCQNNSGNFSHCTNPECTRLQDENLIRGSEILRRISEDNGENIAGVCHMGGGGMCQNSGNFNSCSGNMDRASMRVRQSPNRSSFICRSPVNLRANCVGLPNSDEDFVGNLRRRDDPINYGGATSSLAQIRRRNLDELQEEQFNRRHTIEEEIFNAALDNACVSYKRKAIDENMLNENAIENHLTMRRQAIEDAILNNSLEMVDEATLASMRRNALEESILNCSVNQTITSLRMKDEKNEQIMKRKAIDESMLDENMSFSPIRRKNLDDSKDQNNVSMSPLRRRVLEDSLNNELNSSFASMRRKNLDDSINDSQNASSSPMRRKRMEDNNLAEQAVSLSQLRKKGREDSISSDEQNVSLTTRRKVNNEDVDQNISMSPLRRKILDDKMNQDVINVSLTKKAIEDSMLTNEILRTKALEELISEQNNISRRGNKNIEEILNNHGDSSLISKSNIAQMVQNGNFSINFNNSIHESLEESLAGELGGSRRGIIEGVCLGPDLRYEPVQGFGEGMNVEESNGEAGSNNPVHLRCCSDSNTMDSGWQSGSEKHITD